MSSRSGGCYKKEYCHSPRGIIGDWVEKLHHLVFAVYQKYAKFETNVFRLWSEADQIHRSELEEQIKALVIEREAIMTYESFMECLDS